MEFLKKGFNSNILFYLLGVHTVMGGNSPWCPFVDVGHTKDSFSRDLN